jgi:hypothetical protein
MILQQDVGYHRLIRGQFLLSFFFCITLLSLVFQRIVFDYFLCYVFLQASDRYSVFFDKSSPCRP